MHDRTQPLLPSGGTPSFQGERLADRFVLGAVAGAGAMGLVYRAYDARAERVVAVKVLKSAGIEGLQRFEREAAVLSRLSAPEVAAYVSHGTSSAGQPFLAMEWLEGETLKSRAARARLSFGEAVSVAISVARALSTAHAVGVVHRDIKPANVMIVGHVDPFEPTPGTVKVLDFGVARFRGTGETLTETGAMIGTPAFMSPEQARGAKNVDARSDLFSLGALLFWSLTGRPPFNDDDSIALLLKLTTERAPGVARIVPDTPAPLAQLIDALLDPDPSARPKSAAFVVDALLTVGSRLGSDAEKVPTVLELERTVARSGSWRSDRSTTERTAPAKHLYWIIPAAVAAGAAIAVGVTLTLRGTEAPKPGRTSGSQSTPAPVASPPPTPSGLFLYGDPDRTFTASFECEKPSFRAWPAEDFHGMRVARELVTCETKLGYASVSVNETSSGNLMECDTSFRIGEAQLLETVGGCTIEATESLRLGNYVAQRDVLSCPKTSLRGELRMYCDPTRVAKGENRFYVLWFMGFANRVNVEDAKKFFDSFKPLD